MNVPTHARPQSPAGHREWERLALPDDPGDAEAAETAALFDALSFAAQCIEARKRERQLRLLRAI